MNNNEYTPFDSLPDEGNTNKNIMGLILLELRVHMRDDIKVEFYSTKTGVNASFKAYHGINRVGAPEYAHIVTHKLHRIQTLSSIVKKLRSDSRLYN